jgi:hypothetical protein
MTKKDLEKQVEDLKKERDMWRDIAVQAIKFVPVPVVPNIFPVTVPPYIPYQPYNPIITWCDTNTGNS